MNNEHQRLYALTEHILQQMQQQQGPISFQTWMQSALYAPKLGYYEHEQIFGQTGDFTTGTAMGKWLALGFAETLHQSWLALGSPKEWTLLEQGGGSGDLLCDVLRILAEQGLVPSHIVAVETSEQLRQRQQQRYAEQQLEVKQYTKLAEVPAVEYLMMLSNELPDAFPVLCFIWQDGQMFERGVDWDGEKFVWQHLLPLMPAQYAHIHPSIRQAWPDGYVGEINPHLTTWQQDISHICQHGVVLTVDYGYSQREYYRHQRIDGTLMGHYQHQVVEDVLQLSPGLCDITAHIDFSALKQAGEAVGLHSYTYISQGAWLAQSKSIQQHLQNLAAKPTLESVAQISHAKRLMLPTGLGESFKLLIQGKGIQDTQYLNMPNFNRCDQLDHNK